MADSPAQSSSFVVDAQVRGARFLDDVTVEIQGRTVHVSGVRARGGVAIGRRVLGFTLLLTGLAALLFGMSWAWWLLAASAFVFIVGYLAVWLTAAGGVVTFPLGTVTDVQLGAVQRPADLMIGAGEGIGPALAQASRSGRSLSFRAPGPHGSEVKYSVSAKTRQDAFALASILAAGADAPDQQALQLDAPDLARNAR